ncbi:hypothetical protein GC207_05180 [bacterium]|nr:hypothetical protein [bacterium]
MKRIAWILSVSAVGALLVADLRGCNRETDAQPEVVGTVRFKRQVHRAIALLRQRDEAAYQIVTNNIGRIEEGDRSGMRAYATPPVYVMSDVTAFYSLTWCAATIFHDSIHSKLYHNYQKAHPGPVPDSVWVGRAAERQCMEQQIEAMQLLQASDWEISHAKAQGDGHYVINAESWQEYSNRNW